MVRRGYRSGVVLVFLLIVLAIPVSALLQGYTVEPAFGASGIPAADLVPVSFWDLTFREMAIVTAIAVSPALIFPVEILFALKILSVLGFRRITRKNVLANTVRKTVYLSIVSTPGTSLVELSRATGISRGALAYHLTFLRISGKIFVHKNHGTICYFENSGKYDHTEQNVLKYLHQDMDQMILKALAEQPLLSRTDFEKILGVSGPTVTWHMKRLIDDGILSIRKDGRFSRYALFEKTREYLEKYWHEIPVLRSRSPGKGMNVRHPA